MGSIGTLRFDLRTTAWAQLGTAAGLLTYWPLFFTVGLAPENPPAGYYVFQHSFTVPDIIVAFGFIRTGTWLLGTDASKHPRACALSMVCAGCLIFLGMLDISFNIINGVYLIVSFDTFLEMLINIWCIGFGAISSRECAAYLRAI